MENLSELEIRAADAILQSGNDVKNMPVNYCVKFPKHSDISDVVLNFMAKCLEEDGLIDLTSEGDFLFYKLKPKAHQYQPTNGKSYADFLQEKAKKETDLEEKEGLSLQDLRDKVRDLNPAQSSVLRGTWERHKQTILLGIIVALIGALVTIMVKIWGH
jgi:hypothetical protein